MKNLSLALFEIIRKYPRCSKNALRCYKQKCHAIGNPANKPRTPPITGCGQPAPQPEKPNPGCGGDTIQLPTQTVLPALDPAPPIHTGCGEKPEPTAKGGCILSTADNANKEANTTTKPTSSDAKPTNITSE